MSIPAIIFLIVFVIGFIMFCIGGIANALNQDENRPRWDPSDEYYGWSFLLGSIGTIGFIISFFFIK